MKKSNNEMNVGFIAGCSSTITSYFITLDDYFILIYLDIPRLLTTLSNSPSPLTVASIDGTIVE